MGTKQEKNYKTQFRATLMPLVFIFLVFGLYSIEEFLGRRPAEDVPYNV